MFAHRTIHRHSLDTPTPEAKRTAARHAPPPVVRGAANDDLASIPAQTVNPLWMITLGLAAFLGLVVLMLSSD